MAKNEKKEDSLAVVAQPYYLVATIRGIGGMLMNRKFSPDEREAWADIQETAEEREHRVWRDKLYYRKDIGVHVRSEAIHECIKQGAQYWGATIPGGGKKTWAKVIKAGLEVIDDMPIGNGTPMEKEDPRILPFGRDVSIGGGKKSVVWRIRPFISPVWEGTFRMLIFDGRLNQELLTRILNYAGRFCGLYDWRPKYGRFELIEIHREEAA